MLWRAPYICSLHSFSVLPPGKIRAHSAGSQYPFASNVILKVELYRSSKAGMATGFASAQWWRSCLFHHGLDPNGQDFSCPFLEADNWGFSPGDSVGLVHWTQSGHDRRLDSGEGGGSGRNRLLRVKFWFRRRVQMIDVLQSVRITDRKFRPPFGKLFICSAGLKVEWLEVNILCLGSRCFQMLLLLIFWCQSTKKHRKSTASAK